MQTLTLSLSEFGSKWRTLGHLIEVTPEGEEKRINQWNCNKIIIQCGEREFNSKPIQDAVSDLKKAFEIEVVRDETSKNSQIPLIAELTLSENDVPHGWIMYWLDETPLSTGGYRYDGSIDSIYDSASFAFDLNGSEVTFQSWYRFAQAEEPVTNWSTDIPESYREGATENSSPCVRLPRSKDYVDIPTIINRIFSDREIHIIFPKEKWAFYKTTHESMI